MTDRSDRPLVEVLADQIDRTLQELLAGVRRVALVNYPNISNAGDPAIWLGTIEALRRRGIRPIYQCDHRTYDRRALRHARPEMILINGGGNFGDLWAWQQHGRERVVADFPSVPTVQLPQSIHFASTDNLVRMQRLVDRHADFTLLVRDRASLAFAERSFACPAHLCPDMAFALGSQQRRGVATRDVLWLVRRDKESTAYVIPSSDLDVAVVDWLEPLADEPRWRFHRRLALRANARLTRDVERTGGSNLLAARALAATYRPLARARIERGMSILARGRVVITDRLHGHILSLLQDIPHVVLDNSYGKINAFHATYTASSTSTHLAASPQEALRLACLLLGND